ncbi:hypothetical protein [Shigella dysenteriae]|nr:hypothetical protein [Shigella dysenteriae]WNT51987.1 hypothetical protein PWP84_07105 [Shigella dysenteriae]
MNVNAGHERTSKARIIHQIQLIRGITRCFYKNCYKYRGHNWYDLFSLAKNCHYAN